MLGLNIWHISMPSGLPNRPLDPNGPVAFMHIPKCGGTSFLTALAGALERQFSGLGCDVLFFGDYTEFDQISAETRSHIYFGDKSQIGDARLMGGHTSLSTFEQDFPHFQRVTLLREPATRILSNWVFLRCREEVDFQPWGKEWTRRNQVLLGSLADFMTVKEAIPFSDNLIARMLLRPHPLIPIDGPIDERNDARIVDEAIAQLGKFHFIDLVENPRLNENLSAWLQRPLSLNVLNKTEKVRDELKRSMDEELTQDVLDLIRHRSRLDARLWDHVAQSRLTAHERRLIPAQSLAGAIDRYRRLMAVSHRPTPLES